MTGIALAALLACSTDAQQPPAAGAQDPAARVGERTITTRELDERWRADDPTQHAQATQATFDGRRAALDAMVAEMLIEQAAKAKAVTPAQYTEAEVVRRVRPVTDAEVAVFYGENRGQMQGRALEDMSPLIRKYLEDAQRQSARAAMIADLRKAGPAVRMLLDAPRVQLALAGDEPALGPANAPVTLVEFSDFQCPFCQRVEPTLKRIREKYGDKVRIVWKDFPLVQIHPEAFKSAEAANCAREQGKFWEYHERLFTNQQALQVDALKNYAAGVGLNTATFNACLDSSKHEQRVRDSLAMGSRLGVSSTPAVFVNGRAVTGAQPMEYFEAIIDDELERATRK